MIEGILFDCDGVIVDSEKGLALISANVLNHFYDVPAQANDFTEFIGTGEDAYIGGVVKKHGFVYMPEMKHRIYDEYIKTAVDYVEPMQGINELLVELKEMGYKIAVASSADFPKVKVNLDVINVKPEYFTAVITGNDVTNKKPDPEIYLLAAGKCGLNPASCLVVEDAVSGVLSAKSAGMTACGLTSSLSADVLQNAGADYIIESLDELIGVIDEINRK